MRRNRVSVLADNIFGLVVIIAHRISDLSGSLALKELPSCHLQPSTHMHVNHLSITPMSVNNSRDDDQLILCDKISNASLLALRFVSRMSDYIKFEGRCERSAEKEKKVGDQP